MIARFMFGPLLREEEILHIRNDPRVGGEFSYKVRRGDDEIDHVGTFLELDPPKRIVFTWTIAPEKDGSDRHHRHHADARRLFSSASSTKWRPNGPASSIARAAHGKRCSASSRRCSRPTRSRRCASV